MKRFETVTLRNSIKLREIDESKYHSKPTTIINQDLKIKLISPIVANSAGAAIKARTQTGRKK